MGARGLLTGEAAIPEVLTANETFGTFAFDPGSIPGCGHFFFLFYLEKYLFWVDLSLFLLTLVRRDERTADFGFSIIISTSTSLPDFEIFRDYMLQIPL